MRSACLAMEFEDSDGYMVYAKPVRAAFTEHRGRKAAAGNGGTPIGSGDPVAGGAGMSEEHCRAYCEATSTCSCVAYYNDGYIRPPSEADGLNHGQCWMLSACEPADFEVNSNYKVYTKDSVL